MITVLEGDCRDMLRTLPDASVHCVVTSPPYWSLRNYGVEGQLGLEATPDEFVAVMVDVFREVRRVLRDDGTLWLNLGDSYAANGISGQNQGWAERSAEQYRGGGHKAEPSRVRIKQTVPQGLKAKDLIGIPWMVAFALRADGWWLRKDVIWHKPNPMPESATDRPTSSHEHVFLFAKSAKYFFDGEAVREGRTQDEDANTFRGGSYVAGEPGKRAVVGNKRIKVPGGWDQGDGAHGTIHRDGRTEATYQEAEVRAGRNIRDVWTIATAPFSESHFATFAPELAERCIKAGSSEKGCCQFCRAPWVRIVTKGQPDLAHQRASGGDVNGEYAGQSIKDHDTAGVQNASDVKRRILEGMREKIYDWRPSCGCPIESGIMPCTILDPFGGAGTAGLVADRLGRDAILIELNPSYAAMARRRITKDSPLFAEVK